MKCPECHTPLPFVFVYTEADSKKQCPACKSEIVPTEKSMTEIKLVTGTISFLAATPLGSFSLYLWFENQPWTMLYFLFFGVGSVISVASLYSKYRIRFRQAWLAPAASA